jgi:rubrerythrin
MAKGKRHNYNAFEVLEIAEEIEKKAVEFYNTAINFFEDKETKELFGNLSKWEQTHANFFANMRKELSDESSNLRTFNLDETDKPTAEEMAALSTFGRRSHPAVDFRKNFTKKQILEKAIDKEKSTLVYYIWIKKYVPDSAGAFKIDELINEEMRHIFLINQTMKTMGLI